MALANGARVDFHEPEPGHIVAVATGDLPAVPEGLSAVAIYESLARHSAPQALREAQGRADLVRRQEVPLPSTQVPDASQESSRDLSAPVQARNGVGTAAQALTSTAFQTRYCPSGSYNFYYCWTNRTGTSSIDVVGADSIYVNFNVYRGQAMRNIYYKNTWGNWIVLSSVNGTDENNGAIVHLWSWIHHDTYRVDVTQGAGDGYHVSVYGRK